jgi:hypothetical protein
MIDTAVESFMTLLLAVLAAVVYGILHDQATARVCIVEKRCHRGREYVSELFFDRRFRRK